MDKKNLFSPKKIESRVFQRVIKDLGEIDLISKRKPADIKI